MCSNGLYSRESQIKPNQFRFKTNSKVKELITDQKSDIFKY